MFQVATVIVAMQERYPQSAQGTAAHSVHGLRFGDQMLETALPDLQVYPLRATLGCAARAA